MGDSGSRGGGGKSRGSLPPDFPCLVTAAASASLGDPSHPLSLPVAPCIDLIVNKWRPLTFEHCGQAQGRDIIAVEEQWGALHTGHSMQQLSACTSKEEDGIRLILAVSPPWGRIPCRLTSRKVTSPTSPRLPTSVDNRHLYTSLEISTMASYT